MRLLFLLLTGMLISCGAHAPEREGRPERPPLPPPSAESAPRRSFEPPPPPAPSGSLALVAPAPTIDLVVPGFLDAVLAVPVGARERRPILVATHGNYDNPAWTCEIFRQVAGERPFVLCPRGLARRDTRPPDVRFEYAANAVLEREIDAAFTALATRFPDHVDAAAPIYAGFSQGAIMGVAIALRAPKRFARLALVEGGSDQFTDEAAARFAKGGGERVLFACGSPWCTPAARRAAARLERAGVAAKVVIGEGVGHGYDGAVAERLRENFAWLAEARPGW